MGRVDLALRREGSFRRLYAVKRLHSHLRDDPEFRDMFMDEARVAGLIQHPNVVGVLDVGEDDDGPFLVMNFVDGLSLAVLLAFARESGAPLPLQAVVRIAIELTKGLHAAHELVDHDGNPLHLVHRDLSPQNVLIGWDGTVRITDFGIAKALGRSSKTATGVIKGKSSYMSPEQLRYQEADRRSDIFALGIIIYEMVTGERLYKNKEGSDGIRRILEEPPPDIGEVRPEAPATLTALLFRVLAKDRDARLATAAEVGARLEEVLAELLEEEEPLDLPALLADVTGDYRDERKAALSELVAKAERQDGGKMLALGKTGPAEVPAKTNSTPWLVAGAVSLLVVVGVGAWALGRMGAAEETRRPIGDQVVQIEDETTPTTPAPDPAELPPADPEPEPAPTPEPPPSELTATEETVEASAVMRPRMRPRMRRGMATETMTMAAESTGSGGTRWDEWE